MSDNTVAEVVRIFDEKFEKMRKATITTLLSFGVIVFIFVFGAGGLYYKVNAMSNKIDKMETVSTELSKLKLTLASQGVKIDE